MFFILNEQHEVVPCASLMLVADSLRNNIVGFDKVGGCEVSTVFLSVKHPGGMFFETMVFGDARHRDDQWRYRTWEEAVEGHKRIVEMLRAEDAETQTRTE